jgi:hypothetical protein
MSLFYPLGIYWEGKKGFSDSFSVFFRNLSFTKILLAVYYPYKRLPGSNTQETISAKVSYRGEKHEETI